MSKVSFQYLNLKPINQINLQIACTFTVWSLDVGGNALGNSVLTRALCSFTPCAYTVMYSSGIWYECHLRCWQNWGIKLLYFSLYIYLYIQLFLFPTHAQKHTYCEKHCWDSHIGTNTHSVDLFHAPTITCYLLKTADTYYRWSSCASYVKDVSVPLLCISAMDDPVCTAEAIPWDECR